MKQEVLIPPMPEEYVMYSEGEKVEKAEEFYKEVEDMYKSVDAIHEKYKDKINHLLQNEVSSELLCDIMKEKNVQNLCGTLNEFHALKKLSRIARLESMFQEPSVLQNFDTIEEATCWLQRCLFFLRRFEFDREEDGELLLLIKEKKLSYICLAEMILDKSIVQKIYTTERVARYLYENEQKREALLFVMRIEQMLPYSDRKIIAFAMVVLDMGECRLAYEVLLKYKKPTEDIQQLQRELRGLLQEKMKNE